MFSVFLILVWCVFLWLRLLISIKYKAQLRLMGMSMGFASIWSDRIFLKKVKSSEKVFKEKLNWQHYGDITRKVKSVEFILAP